MRQQIHYIFGRVLLKTTLKACPLIVLMISCLSGGQARSDSTFFPEGSAEAKANETAQEGSDAIKEWAELKPPKEKPADLISPKNKKTDDISLAPPQAPLPPEKLEAQKEPSSAIVAVTPDVQKSPTSDEPKPLPIIADSETSPSIAVPTTTTTTPATVDPKTALPTDKPKPLPTAAVTANPPVAEQKPLKSTMVEPRPKVLPVQEKVQAKEQGKSPKTVVSYSDAANDRSPLGILDPAQEVHNQRWYIYSSAIRGLKNPSDSVHIVCMNGTPSDRGEEVKNLLVDMGIEPEKVQLIHAKGEENQAKFIYIFAGK